MDKVDANPTKEFFISMLTRDVSLDRAILDLVDNSVDAAHKYGALKDRVVNIKIGKDEFQIFDNCGGFSIEDAKKYAFRFGRDREDERSHKGHTVGQFGVGMKRTLFKLGKVFEVKSQKDGEAFSIQVNVDDWLETKDWEFNLNKEDTSDGEDGTFIVVNNLAENISSKFEDNDFLVSLIDQISKAHFRAIGGGLTVKVNETNVDLFNLKIKTSDELTYHILSKEKDGVKLTIRAGISEQDYEKGGWYIVCNGRLVEAADKTKKTLWGTNDIPKYHDRFAFFRGVVELDSNDSSKLPWTTTKTGVDVDHQVYKWANAYMIEALEPIVDFLNERERERKEEREGRVSRRVLEEAISEASTISIFDVSETNAIFTAPEKESPRPPEYGNITYQQRIELIEIVKEVTGLSTNKEIGEKTFEYYFENECS